MNKFGYGVYRSSLIQLAAATGRAWPACCNRARMPCAASLAAGLSTAVSTSVETGREDAGLFLVIHQPLDELRVCRLALRRGFQHGACRFHTLRQGFRHLAVPYLTVAVIQAAQGQRQDATDPRQKRVHDGTRAIPPPQPRLPSHHLFGPVRTAVRRLPLAGPPPSKRVTGRRRTPGRAVLGQSPCKAPG